MGNRSSELPKAYPDIVSMGNRSSELPKAYPDIVSMGNRSSELPKAYPDIVDAIPRSLSDESSPTPSSSLRYEPCSPVTVPSTKQSIHYLRKHIKQYATSTENMFTVLL